MMDDLYQPSIRDLEKNEYQGRERAVVYLDDVEAALAHRDIVKDRQSRIDELRTINRIYGRQRNVTTKYVQERLHGMGVKYKQPKGIVADDLGFDLEPDGTS